MFLWFKYIFDWENFKKYKELKSSNQNEISENSLAKKFNELQEQIGNLIRNNELSNQSVENTIKEKIEFLQTLNNNNNSNTKDLIDKTIDNLNLNIKANEEKINKQIEVLSANINKSTDNNEAIIKQQIEQLKETNRNNLKQIENLNANKAASEKELLLKNIASLQEKIDNNERIINNQIKNLNQTIDKANSSNKELIDQQINTLKEKNTTNLNELKAELKKLDAINSEKQEEFYRQNNDFTKNINQMFNSNQMRGKFGEFQLRETLFNTFGAMSDKSKQIWNEQVTFKNGKTVDFTIKNESIDRVIPIDSKFPLEKIKRFWESGEKLSENNIKEIKQDIKPMIDKIKKDYIDNNDETTDFALMFVPAENVYNFILNKMPELFNEANNKNVYICSPTNILAIISTYLLASKNISYYKNLTPIVETVKDLNEQYNIFSKRWKKHQDILAKAIDAGHELDVTFRKIDIRAQKINNWNVSQEIDKGEPINDLSQIINQDNLSEIDINLN